MLGTYIVCKMQCNNATTIIINKAFLNYTSLLSHLSSKCIHNIGGPPEYFFSSDCQEINFYIHNLLKCKLYNLFKIKYTSFPDKHNAIFPRRCPFGTFSVDALTPHLPRQTCSQLPKVYLFLADVLAIYVTLLTLTLTVNTRSSAPQTVLSAVL